MILFKREYRWAKYDLFSIFNNHLVDYPTPINISYFWSFGSLAGISLVIQIITGIFFSYALLS